MKPLHYIILGVGITLAVLASWLLGRSYGLNHPTGEVKEKVDTLLVVRVDTLVLPPKLISCEVVDTMVVYVHDSVEVVLPLEVKEYADTSYYARVSGYRPSLDSLVVYPRLEDRIITKVMERTISPPKWSIGVSAGMAAGCFITPAGWQVGAGPAISVGITYRF